MRILLLSFWFGIMSGFAAESEPKDSASYQALEIHRSLFPEEKVAMASAERNDFADHCAAMAANKVALEGRTPKSLSQARTLLSLALQLNPRNRLAVVTNFQLSRGLIPKTRELDYSPEAFASLLKQVGQRLVQTKGTENIQVAGALLTLAVDLDPSNEDLIYTQQLYEIDFGKFSWDSLLAQAPARQLPDTQPNSPPSTSKGPAAGEL